MASLAGGDAGVGGTAAAAAKAAANRGGWRDAEGGLACGGGWAAGGRASVLGCAIGNYGKNTSILRVRLQIYGSYIDTI